MNNIKFVDLPAQYKTIKKKIDNAVLELIKNGKFILGDNGKKLEEQIAHFAGTKYAIGVNSGTDALILALMSLDIRKEDEVITVANSFVATTNAIISVSSKSSIKSILGFSLSLS